MHNTIYKYELNLVDSQIVNMPKGAIILTAQTQRDMICIWAKVDDTAINVARKISIIGTGTALPKLNPDERMEHIDTIQQYGMVWHIFEII